MNFLKATLAWLVISFLIGLGIWLWTVKGSILLLALVTVGFVVAVAKIGCAPH